MWWSCNVKKISYNIVQLMAKMVLEWLSYAWTMHIYLMWLWWSCKIKFLQNACTLQYKLTINSIHVIKQFICIVRMQKMSPCFTCGFFFLLSPYVAYVYWNEVMRWLGYGNKTGRYVDTCSMRWGLAGASNRCLCVGCWYDGVVIVEWSWNVLLSIVVWWWSWK